MTEAQERTFLFVAFVALVALLLWKKAEVAPPDAANNPAEDIIAMSPPLKDVGSGFNWLTYNDPYAFTPPVQTVLPPLSVGQVGQRYAQETNANELVDFF